jgi:hypothetical protein
MYRPVNHHPLRTCSAFRHFVNRVSAHLDSVGLVPRLVEADSAGKDRPLRKLSAFELLAALMTALGRIQFATDIR